MIKIGILTFHKSINYGAFMQAFSLSQKIQEGFPECIVEIIDYVPLRTLEDHKTALSGKAINLNQPIKMILAQLYARLQNPKAVLYRRNRVNAFSKGWECLPLSAEQYYTDDYESVLKDIQSKYDIIVVGSDCVWEFIVDKFPNVFFLNNNNINNKFSYAASTDRIHISELDEKQKRILNDSFSGFRYLGIRDVSTQNLISSINPKLELYHNCDPTIFLDLDKVPWDKKRIEKKLIDKGIDINRPIIGLMGDDNIGKLIRNIFGDTYQVVCVYTYSKYADAYLDDLTPFEWSHVFSFFSICFTRYFHGTILSLKNGTPTITMDPWKMKSNDHVTKIRDLYNRLGLDNRHYYEKKSKYSKHEIEEIGECAKFFIDHPDTAEIEDALIKEGKAYLTFYEALKTCVNELKTNI